jgi:hypothetical protein
MDFAKYKDAALDIAFTSMKAQGSGSIQPRSHLRRRLLNLFPGAKTMLTVAEAAAVNKSKRIRMKNLGWDRKNDKGNPMTKDFKLLRREFIMVEKSKPKIQGRLSFIGIILIKIGFTLIKISNEQKNKN